MFAMRVLVIKSLIIFVNSTLVSLLGFYIYSNFINCLHSLLINTISVIPLYGHYYCYCMSYTMYCLVQWVQLGNYVYKCRGIDVCANILATCQ